MTPDPPVACTGGAGHARLGGSCGLLEPAPPGCCRTCNTYIHDILDPCYKVKYRYKPDGMVRDAIKAVSLCSYNYTLSFLFDFAAQSSSVLAVVCHVLGGAEGEGSGTIEKYRKYRYFYGIDY